MKKLGSGLSKVSTMLFLLHSAAVLAGSPKEDAQFLMDCKRLGKRTILSEKLIDYSLFSKGASKEKKCLYEVNCKAPNYNIDFTGLYPCAFKEGEGCETLDECATKMADRAIGYRLAKIGAPSAKAKADEKTCVDKLNGRHLPGLVEGETSHNSEKNFPMCVQRPECSESNGGTTMHPFTFCLSTGIREDVRLESGEIQNLAVCPDPEDCLRESIKLPTVKEFLQKICEEKQQGNY